MAGPHSPVNLSASTILQSRARIPNTSFIFFPIYKSTFVLFLLLCCEKKENKQKEAGSDTFFKKHRYVMKVKRVCLCE